MFCSFIAAIVIVCQCLVCKELSTPLDHSSKPRTRPSLPTPSNTSPKYSRPRFRSDCLHRSYHYPPKQSTTRIHWSANTSSTCLQEQRVAVLWLASPERQVGMLGILASLCKNQLHTENSYYKNHLYDILKPQFLRSVFLCERNSNAVKLK